MYFAKGDFQVIDFTLLLRFNVQEPRQSESIEYRVKLQL